MRLLVSLTVAAALIVPATASATPNDPNGAYTPNTAIWYSNSFQSPSGNIKCHYWHAPDNEMTCTTLNTGLTLYLTRYLPAGARYAHLAEGHGPTLQYGESWTGSGYTCFSRFNGMTCRTNLGHGFFINRSEYRVW